MKLKREVTCPQKKGVQATKISGHWRKIILSWFINSFVINGVDYTIESSHFMEIGLELDGT